MFAQRLVIATVALIVMSISACSQHNSPTLSAPDAYAQAQAGKLTLIDVRHPDEWHQTGIAKGALHIDMTNAQGEAGFTQQVATEMGGDKHAPIGLISRAGNRSANAQQVLRNAGFTQVFNIKEGMAGNSAGPGWIARGLPVEACPTC